MAGSPQKLALTPLQRDILWLIEEAGSESLTTILVTLTNEKVISASNSSLYDLEAAIRGLIRVGFLTITKDLRQPGLDSVPVTPDELESLQNIRTLFDWDDHLRQWVLNSELGDPAHLALTLTSEGFSTLTR